MGSNLESDGIKNFIYTNLGEFKEDKQNLKNLVYEKGFGFGSGPANKVRGIKEEIENEYGIGIPDVSKNIYYWYASNYRDYDEGHKRVIV